MSIPIPDIGLRFIDWDSRPLMYVVYVLVVAFWGVVFFGYEKRRVCLGMASFYWAFLSVGMVHIVFYGLMQWLPCIDEAHLSSYYPFIRVGTFHTFVGWPIMVGSDHWNSFLPGREWFFGRLLGSIVIWYCAVLAIIEAIRCGHSLAVGKRRSES